MTVMGSIRCDRCGYTIDYVPPQLPEDWKHGGAAHHLCDACLPQLVFYMGPDGRFYRWEASANACNPAFGSWSYDPNPTDEEVAGCRGIGKRWGIDDDIDGEIPEDELAPPFEVYNRPPFWKLYSFHVVTAGVAVTFLLVHMCGT